MTGTATARLDRRSVAGLPHAPRRAAAAAEAGIVHLGLGNFHRAHQAVYTARALDAQEGPWAVVGVASSSRRVVEAMRAQDGLYTVVALDAQSAQPLVVGVHAELLVAAEQPGDVVKRLADRRTRIVTLTVTEHGYTYSGAARRLDRERVRGDLRGDPPATTVGRLARGLQQRLRTHGEPLTIVSCDNLRRSAEHTRALVLEFAQLLGDRELHDWIARSVTFPATMVDRIVPATVDAHRARVTELLGVEDEVPVAAEPFSMWVLEDRFATGRPRWEAGGVIFSDEVERYEALKVRLLNGTHSLVAYLGLLAGARLIADAVAVPEIRAAAERVMRNEYLPTVARPAGFDVECYMAQLLSRFGNRAIGHETSQVACDGSLKLPVRLGDAVLHHHAAGAVPRLLALTVAAFIRCLATPEAYDAAAVGAIRDPSAARLAELGRRYGDSHSLVAAVFDCGIFGPAVAQAETFVDAVAALHEALARGGWRAGIEAAS